MTSQKTAAKETTGDENVISIAFFRYDKIKFLCLVTHNKYCSHRKQDLDLDMRLR